MFANFAYNHFDNGHSLKMIAENTEEITEELETYDSSCRYMSKLQLDISISFYKFFDMGFEKYFNISDESKNLIELIFRKFGNYSIQELGPMIDQMCDLIPIEKKYGKNFISQYSFSNFLYKNHEKLKNNVVFQFVCDFDRLDISKSYSKPYSRKPLIDIDSESSKSCEKIEIKSYPKLFSKFIKRFKKLNPKYQKELINYLIELSNENDLESKKIPFKKRYNKSEVIKTNETI